MQCWSHSDFVAWRAKVHLITMEGELVSSKKYVFTGGAPGTMSLADFEEKFCWSLEEMKLQYKEEFTAEIAFMMMRNCLAGEALMYYRLEKNEVMKTASVYASRTSVHVKQNLKKPVDMTEAEEDSEMESTTMPVNYLVKKMFEKLWEMFSPYSLEKIQELCGFAFKPDEPLRAAYLRLKQLVVDTKVKSMREAAEIFIAAMDCRQRSKVVDAVHRVHGEAYELEEVYTIAEKVLREDIVSSYWEEHNLVRSSHLGNQNAGIYQLSTEYGEQGQSSRYPKHAAEKENFVHSAGTVNVNCARCHEAHKLGECDHRPGASKGKESCKACNRWGHTEAACWQAHLELRPNDESLSLRDLGVTLPQLKQMMQELIREEACGGDTAAGMASLRGDHLKPGARGRGGVAMVANAGREITFDGFAVRRVIVGTGIAKVLLGAHVQEVLELYGSKLIPSDVCMTTFAGREEQVLGKTKDPVKIELKPGTPDACVVEVQCLVTDATTYDVMLGADATHGPAMGVDPFLAVAFYRPGWKDGDYTKVAKIPLNMRRHSETF